MIVAVTSKPIKHILQSTVDGRNFATKLMIAIKIPSARTSRKHRKEKHFLSHLQTVDGRNFATKLMIAVKIPIARTS